MTDERISTFLFLEVAPLTRVIWDCGSLSRLERICINALFASHHTGFWGIRTARIVSPLSVVSSLTQTHRFEPGVSLIWRSVLFIIWCLRKR